MMCQAAGQTRFRALHHENGIAGSATIVVRVIACFQPLQDCQEVLVFPCSQEFDSNQKFPILRQVIVSNLTGEDCGMWHPQQHFDSQSHNLNSMGKPLMLGKHNVASTIGTLPVRGLQTFTPTNPYESCREAVLPNAGSVCVQKNFLVFDQSGNQTTMIFCPGIGTSMQTPNPWSPKPLGGYNMNEVSRTKKGTDPHLQCSESRETDEQSEMHEDTEELNVLLYSDSDSDNTEDDDVTSTGHSPITMTAQNKQDWFEERKSVASYAEPTKKRKIFDQGCDDITSFADTASSVNANCTNCKNADSGELRSRNKRTRKERILESVSILQSIIPNVKGKGATVVLDEAIRYLKSLKVKAEALRLGTL